MSIIIENTTRLEAIIAEQSMVRAHLFNSTQYLSNKSFPVKGWQMIKEKPVAQIFFYIEHGVAISGYQSTFGSFDIVEQLTAEELAWFIASIIKELKMLGVSKIKIKNPPSYFNNALAIDTALSKHGFTSNVTELNQHIIVKNRSFYEVAKRNEVRRSDKCKAAGFRFEIASINKLTSIYSLTESTLNRKGNKLSISFEELEKTIKNIPNRYILFAIWDNDTLVASTVSVIVTDAVLYNFYHAHHQDYILFSPLTYLLKNIYLHCIEHNFKILDLGISTVNGSLNEGLFLFKKNRGAESSEKKVFQLTI